MTDYFDLLCSPFIRSTCKGKHKKDHAPIDTFHEGEMGFVITKKDPVPRLTVSKRPAMVPTFSQFMTIIMKIMNSLLTENAPIAVPVRMKALMVVIGKGETSGHAYHATCDMLSRFSGGVMERMSRARDFNAIRALWMDAKRRTSMVDVLFADLRYKRARYSERFDMAFEQLCVAYGHVADRIIDVLVSRFVYPVELDDIDTALSILHALGRAASRFTAVFTAAICERAFIRVKDISMGCQAFFDHAEEVLDYEVGAAKQLLCGRDLIELKAKISARVLDCKMTDIQREMITLVQFGYSDTFGKIMSFARKASSAEKMIALLGFVIESMVAQAISGNNAMVSLCRVITVITNICSKALVFAELKKLQVHFEKALNAKPIAVARILSYDMHNVMKSNVALDVDIAAAIIVKIERQDVFQETHCYLMIQRLLGVSRNVARERVLIDALKIQVGPEAVMKYQTVLASQLNIGIDFGPFKCILLPSTVFPVPKMLEMRGPFAVLDCLNNMHRHIMKLLPRRHVAWHFGMSAVSMTFGGLRVKCPATHALLLMAIIQSTHGITLAALANILNMDTNFIEELLSTLRSEQCGKLVVTDQDQRYILNNIYGLIRIPVMIDSAHKQLIDERNIAISTQQLEMRLDCVIVSTMKQTRTMPRSRLKNSVDATLQQEIDETCFTARLNSLEKRRLLKNVSDEIHYVL